MQRRLLLAANQHAKTIDIHNEFPVFFSHVEEIHRLVYARVVELDVKLAKSVNRFGNHRAHLITIGHVHCAADHFATVLGGQTCIFCRYFGDFVQVDICETHVSPVDQQVFTYRTANPLRRTCDDT